MPSSSIPESDSLTSNLSDLNNASSLYTDQSSLQDSSFSSSLRSMRSFMDTHALQVRGDCHHIQRLRHSNMLKYLRLRQQNDVLKVLRKAIASKLQSLDKEPQLYSLSPPPLEPPSPSAVSTPASTVTDDTFSSSFSMLSSVRQSNASASSASSSKGWRFGMSSSGRLFQSRSSFDERTSRMKKLNPRAKSNASKGSASNNNSHGEDKRHLLKLYIEAIDNVQTSFRKVRWAKLRDDFIRKSTLPVVTSRSDYATPGKGVVAFSDRLLHAAHLEDLIQRCMAKQEYLLNEAEDKLTSSVLGVRLYPNRGSH